MQARKNLGGSPIIPYHAYPIAASTAVSKGQAVKLSGGKVVKASAADTAALLGVAAESHTGAEDALNDRANGESVYVYDDIGTLFACPAPTVTVTSGTATTLVSSGIAAFADDDFNGGCVKLVSKAANSTNTDSVGTVRKITDFTASSKTFTIESGGAPYAGDVYAVFPPVGFAKGNFDSSISKLVLTATAALKVKTAGHELGAGNILVQRTA